MKWNLGRGIGLVARCEYDAIMPTQQGKVFINIKALNEWDSKVCCVLTVVGWLCKFLMASVQ